MRVFQEQTCGSRQNAGKGRFDKLFDACANKRFRVGLKAKPRRLDDIGRVFTSGFPGYLATENRKFREDTSFPNSLKSLIESANFNRILRFLVAKILEMVMTGCHSEKKSRRIATPTCWRCEMQRLFPRKHTSTQFSDVLLHIINHIQTVDASNKSTQMTLALAK